MLSCAADPARSLRNKRVGGYGADVYEREEGMFFNDRSTDILQDDTWAVLESLPNVIMTAHQAFFTAEALQEISNTVSENIISFVTAPEQSTPSKL